MSKGYIYVMTNPCLKNMVKIGYAADVELRRKQLSTTALPYEYEVYATYETSGNLEDKKLHRLIDNLNPDLRVSKNREFFVMKPKEAYELLEAIAIISGSQDKLTLLVDMFWQTWSSSAPRVPRLLTRAACKLKICTKGLLLWAAALLAYTFCLIKE